MMLHSVLAEGIHINTSPTQLILLPPLVQHLRMDSKHTLIPAGTH